MKKLIFASVLCLSVAYCVDRHVASEKRKEQIEEKKKAEFSENQELIRALIAEYSANYKWYELFERKDRSFGQKLMQAELENEWVSQNPIIFIGTIEDYRNLSGGRYQVTIKPDIFSGSIWLSDVGLDLVASKNFIDQFTREHPEALSRNLASRDGSVVVIAKITTVEKRREGSGEDADVIRYGVGDLVEMKMLKGALPFRKNVTDFTQPGPAG